MEQKNRIRIAIISGSVRPENNTLKAVSVVADEISKHKEIVLDVFDMSQYKLPLPGLDDESSEVVAFRETVAAATGVILATPEYHGTFSSVIKLAIENLGYPSVMAGKPIGLLGVASGALGAVKSLEHLRGVCAHCGGIVLPGAASIAAAHKAFDSTGNCTDEDAEARMRGLANKMINYIESHICPRWQIQAQKCT